MDRATKILKETDPYLREIWALGWDRVIRHEPSMNITLVNDTTKEIKEISIREFAPWFYTIKKGVLPNGEIHAWISETDGSAEKFRSVVKSAVGKKI
jgi:hypothetical protein